MPNSKFKKKFKFFKRDLNKIENVNDNYFKLFKDFEKYKDIKYIYSFVYKTIEYDTHFRFSKMDYIEYITLTLNNGLIIVIEKKNYPKYYNRSLSGVFSKYIFTIKFELTQKIPFYAHISEIVSVIRDNFTFNLNIIHNISKNENDRNGKVYKIINERPKHITTNGFLEESKNFIIGDFYPTIKIDGINANLYYFHISNTIILKLINGTYRVFSNNIKNLKNEYVVYNVEIHSKEIDSMQILSKFNTLDFGNIHITILDYLYSIQNNELIKYAKTPMNKRLIIPNMSSIKDIFGKYNIDIDIKNYETKVKNTYEDGFYNYINNLILNNEKYREDGIVLSDDATKTVFKLKSKKDSTIDLKLRYIKNEYKIYTRIKSVEYEIEKYIINEDPHDYLSDFYQNKSLINFLISDQNMFFIIFEFEIFEDNLNIRNFRIDKFIQNDKRIFEQFDKYLTIESFDPLNLNIMRDVHNNIKKGLYEYTLDEKTTLFGKENEKLKSMTLVDIGAGRGGNAYIYKRYGKVILIEPNSKFIEDLEDRLKNLDVEYVTFPEDAGPELFEEIYNNQQVLIFNLEFDDKYLGLFNFLFTNLNLTNVTVSSMFSFHHFYENSKSILYYLMDKITYFIIINLDINSLKEHIETYRVKSKYIFPNFNPYEGKIYKDENNFVVKFKDFNINYTYDDSIFEYNIPNLLTGAEGKEVVYDLRKSLEDTKFIQKNNQYNLKYTYVKEYKIPKYNKIFPASVRMYSPMFKSYIFHGFEESKFRKIENLTQIFKFNNISYRINEDNINAKDDILELIHGILLKYHHDYQNSTGDIKYEIRNKISKEIEIIASLHDISFYNNTDPIYYINKNTMKWISKLMNLTIIIYESIGKSKFITDIKHTLNLRSIVFVTDGNKLYLLDNV